MAPTLSVIMPVYNHAEYVGQALEALVSQSFRATEIVVIDDSSTDSSFQIIDSWARRYKIIRVIRNKANIGGLASVQKALALVTSDYNYDASADDWVLPGFFESAMRMAERYPEAGIIFGKFCTVSPDGEHLSTCEIANWQSALYATPESFRKEYLERNAPDHSLCGATIYKRDYLLEVGGFRESLGHWADTFAARAIALKYGACYIPQEMMCWRQIPSSLSNKSARDVNAQLQIVFRAARLMESAAFRDRFPSDHVRWWEQRYTELLIMMHIGALVSEQMEKRYGDGLRAIGRQGHFGRSVSRLSERLIRKWLNTIRGTKERTRLKRYYASLA